MATTEKGDFDLGEFVEKNKKTITWTAGSVAGIALIGWFWTASADRQALRAEQAYASAERSTYSGNAKLAEADLQGVVNRYGSTSAGVQASMLLAKQFFADSGKASDGIAVLKAALGRGASKPFRAELASMLGAGYEAAGRFDSAATAFRDAASAAASVSDREQYQANEARALTSAGKKPDAVKVWQTIAARETSPLLNEAKLRIAELTVATAKGG